MNLTNQPALREELLMYVLKNPQGLRPLAGRIGIGYRTLKRFIIDNMDITIPSMIKVAVFLDGLEKKV